MSLFHTLARSGAFEPVDVHLGRLLERRDAGETADVVALSAALLSRERGRGHSCIDLGDYAGRPLDADGPATLPPLPALAQWQRALASSPLVGDGSESTPLVRDTAGRLYLSRYWRAEQRLARNLRSRLATEARAPAEADVAGLFRALFPPPPDASADRQAVAAAAALFGRVTLVTGGPGTGKTTTVARILAMLLAGDPELEIALAAPTGKAAARLGEAVTAQVGTLPVDPALRARIPTAAATLHRLLGYQPRRGRFRYHSRRPLACDALVVDEASMVDLLLMDAALDALAPHARVILLGDRDQLTSVETGFVFGDLCAAAPADGRFSRRFADLYRRLAGYELPTASSEADDPLRDAVIELVTSYRFGAQPGIGELASAARARDAGRVLEALDGPARADVDRLEPSDGIESALSAVAEPLDAYLTSPTPADALSALGGFRVLCGRRRGDWGVRRMNAAVERLLLARGHPVGEGHYPGRPILVTANDYQVRLFNGDLGVCWLRSGRLWAWFSGPGGEPRRLPLAKLPPHETAWAMTVHKAQGSEFDHVLLALGDADSRGLTRELFYTGVTRARRHVAVLASPDVVRAAVSRGERRVSGLADALRAGLSAPQPGAVSRRRTANATAPAGESPPPGQLPLFE